MLDPKYIVSLKGKAYPLWAGVLDAATKTGLRSLSTTLLQAPAPENGQLAIVLATAVFEDGRTFSDLGDAGPQNCSAQIASAAVRMASTRAKGRCLRDALNIGETMYEELPEEERTHAAAANGGHRPAVVPDRSGETQTVVPGNDVAARHGPVCQICQEPLKPSVYRASIERFARPLCIAHGKEAQRAVDAVKVAVTPSEQ